MSEPPTDQVPVMASSVEATGGMVGLTPLAQQYLDQTRPWVRFISIMTFVWVGFMVMMSIGMLVFSVFGGLAARNKQQFGALGNAIVTGVLSLVYVVLAFLYIAPGVYLFRYANAITHLKANGTAAALEDTLKHQKSFWRYVGILIAVSLIVTVVGIILAVSVGVIAAVMAARS